MMIILTSGVVTFARYSPENCSSARKRTPVTGIWPQLFGALFAKADDIGRRTLQAATERKLQQIKNIAADVWFNVDVSLPGSVSQWRFVFVFCKSLLIYRIPQLGIASLHFCLCAGWRSNHINHRLTVEYWEYHRQTWSMWSNSCTTIPRRLLIKLNVFVWKPTDVPDRLHDGRSMCDTDPFTYIRMCCSVDPSTHLTGKTLVYVSMTLSDILV